MEKLDLCDILNSASARLEFLSVLLVSKGDNLPAVRMTRSDIRNEVIDLVSDELLVISGMLSSASTGSTGV